MTNENDDTNKEKTCDICGRPLNEFNECPECKIKYD